MADFRRVVSKTIKNSPVGSKEEYEEPTDLSHACNFSNQMSSPRPVISGMRVGVVNYTMSAIRSRTWKSITSFLKCISSRNSQQCKIPNFPVWHGLLFRKDINKL